MTQALLTHHLDQQAAEIKEWCAGVLDLHDESVRAAIQLVTTWTLTAGRLAEPDDRAVAGAMFLMASAWHEVTR